MRGNDRVNDRQPEPAGPPVADVPSSYERLENALLNRLGDAEPVILDEQRDPVGLREGSDLDPGALRVVGASVDDQVEQGLGQPLGIGLDPLGWQLVNQLDSSSMSVLQEVLGGVRVVKAFGQEDRERDRYLESAGKKVRTRTRLAFVEGALGVAISIIVALGSAAVLFIGVNHVRYGELTLGSLLLVMSYLSQLYRPLETISERIGQVQSSLVSAERAFVLLDEATEVVERPHATRVRRARGEIVFQEVTFAYDGSQPVLHNVSFRISAGTSLGIAGTTGAGKTTLVSLLMRFYDPTDGRIMLDGMELRDYHLADLRNQFALVLQEPCCSPRASGRTSHMRVPARATSTSWPQPGQLTRTSS